MTSRLHSTPTINPVRLVDLFIMIRRPPRSTLFPTRRSSDLDRPVLRRLRRARGGGGADPLRRGGHPGRAPPRRGLDGDRRGDRKSTRLNSSHSQISYAVFCLKKKK